MSDKKLWGGRFSEKIADVTEKLSSSIQFDKRLYSQDIRGSMAHARMLHKIGILTYDELHKIVDGLSRIELDINEDRFVFKKEFEDIHMNIESRLTEMIGDAGKKLHTARSRNDQIALDSRLYIRDEAAIIKSQLKDLVLRLIELSEEHLGVIMPGYTHLQIAQPVRFSQHLLAHCWAFKRDIGRLDFVLSSLDEMPLGVGALAGVNYSNDRIFLRDELGFSDITHNSMDTVADRDYVLNFLYFASILGMHLSRFCEEIILWTSSEFAYVRLSDRVTTGSSIMPQKKNSDLAELIRGKTGRLYGNLVSLLVTMKGIPLSYNRDMQEDKEPLFDSIDTIKVAIDGMLAMFEEIVINSDKMKASVYKNFSTATDLADYLAVKGLPFRKAHEIVGNIVRYCEDINNDFFKLSLTELKSFSDIFAEDVFDYLSPVNSTERKLSIGGTSTSEILKQIEEMKKLMN